MKKQLLATALILFTLATKAQNVGIGTNDPKSKLDIQGNLSLREGTALALVNGNNDNVALTGNYSFYRITGPTAAFSINGIVPVSGADGQILTLVNTTTQILTIKNEAASSTATNRISVAGGSDLVSVAGGSSVTLQYNKAAGRWYVTASQNFIAPSNGVANISVTAPITTSGGANPTIGLGVVPVANGGTGLTAIAAGQIAIGNGSNTYANATISSGTGINVVSGAGSITVNNTAPDQTVTLTGGGINSVSGTYPNFTVTGTEVDGSVTNEAQTLAGSGTNDINLTQAGGAGGGTITLQGSGATSVSRSGNTFTINSSNSGGTVTQVNTGTGLTGGPITGTGTISMANVGTPGTYTKVTTNAQGQVTSGTTLSAGDIPNLAGDVTGPINNAQVVDDSHNHTELEAKGQYTWSASTNPRDFPQAISASFVRAADGWPEYGSVVNVGTYPNDGGTLQLYAPYAPAYGGNSLRYRLGLYNNAGWTGWKTIWDDTNDGSGSGMDADMTDGFHASQSIVGNNIVVRDASGYIMGNYINTTDNVIGSGVTGIVVKQGDNYHRTATAAAVLSFLGVTAPTGDNLGNHTATTTLNMANNTISAAAFVNVTAGDGYGVRFWGADLYKIHMGNSSEYHYGPVTDYSIKTNMSNTAGRGWTWGVSGSTPVAGIECTTGNMQIKGNMSFGNYLFGNGKYAIDATDSWLRLNQQNSFTSGTYTPYLFRADGGYQVDGNTVIDADAGWHRTYGQTGWYNQTYASGMYATTSGEVATYNGSYLRITGSGNGSGNLRFDATNPYIVAPSYFVCPGGAYFNNLTVYFEAATQHRGGIQNDAGSYGGSVKIHDGLTVGDPAVQNYSNGSCNAGSANSGGTYDCWNTQIQVPFNCGPGGATITNVNFGVAGTFYCTYWMYWQYYTPGGWAYLGCDGTYNTGAWNGYGAGTNFWVRVVDNDAYCDYLSNFSENNVTFSYTYPNGTTPVYASYGQVRAQGTLYANTTSAYGDVAEFFKVTPREREAEAGDIVSIDPSTTQSFILTTKTNDHLLAGVISENPSVFLNSPSEGKPVALTGRVKVKVCSEGGKIKPGDPITSSSLQGVGMKAKEDGTIIGYAMENYFGKDDQIGKIWVLLDKGHFEKIKTKTKFTETEDVKIGGLSYRGAEKFDAANKTKKILWRSDFTSQITSDIKFEDMAIDIKPFGGKADVVVLAVDKEGFTVEVSNESPEFAGIYYSVEVLSPALYKDLSETAANVVSANGNHVNTSDNAVELYKQMGEYVAQLEKKTGLSSSSFKGNSNEEFIKHKQKILDSWSKMEPELYNKYNSAKERYHILFTQDPETVSALVHAGDAPPQAGSLADPNPLKANAPK